MESKAVSEKMRLMSHCELSINWELQNIPCCYGKSVREENELQRVMQKRCPKDALKTDSHRGIKWPRRMMCGLALSYLFPKWEPAEDVALVDSGRI